MNLLPAWRDSLTLFKPKNFKLFFLVTLKTMVDTFKVWIKYFWWLPVIEFVMPRFFLGFSNPWLSVAASILMSILWSVSILLAARPSVALKNCSYFRSYIWRIIYIAPVAVAMDLGKEYLMGTFFYPYIGQPSSLTAAVFVAIIITGIINWSIRIYVINYALFVLDTDASIKQALKSLLYALKMLTYNYPFYIIVYIVHSAITIAKYLLFLQVTKWYYSFATGMENMYPKSDSIGLLIIRYSDMLIFALLTIFLYCFLTNFYIKKLHDQFTLYFGKNE